MDPKNETPTPTTDAEVTARPSGGGISTRIDGILKEHHGHLSDDQRAMVVSLATAQRWSGDISEKLDKAVQAFGDPVSYRPGAKQPVIRTFDPGAPAGPGALAVPIDPAAIPKSVSDNWTNAQAQAWWAAYKAAGGAFVHPFAHARNAETEGAADIAGKVAQALAAQFGIAR